MWLSLRVLPIEAVIAEADGFQLAIKRAEMAGDVEHRACGGIEHDPDQAVPDRTGQRAQAQRVALQVGKRFCAGQAGQ